MLTGFLSTTSANEPTHYLMLNRRSHSGVKNFHNENHYFSTNSGVVLQPIVLAFFRNSCHLNLKTMPFFFVLWVHTCRDCGAIFSSFSFRSAHLPFSAPSKFLPTLFQTSVCRQSCSRGKLLSKQCMVLTLRWKRHAGIILAARYHTASFPNGTENLTFSWSRRCQKMTFVHSIT